MSNTLYDDGVVENFKVENNRVSFKLNDKTYACFEKQKNGEDNQVAKDTKAIIINDSSQIVAIEFYDNEKDGKTYHNLTKIEIASEIKEETVQQEQIKETPLAKPVISEINGAEFGLCCHLSQRLVSALGEPFSWKMYEEKVKEFYKTNRRIKEEIRNDTSRN